MDRVQIRSRRFLSVELCAIANLDDAFPRFAGGTRDRIPGSAGGGNST